LAGMRDVFAGKAQVLYAQGSSYAEELPVPVPSSVFHLSANGEGPGLKGEYFANTDFSGTPVLTRVDPQIQFDWYAASPAPGVPKKSFCRTLDWHADSSRTRHLHLQRPQTRIPSQRRQGGFSNPPGWPHSPRHRVADSYQLDRGGKGTRADLVSSAFRRLESSRVAI